MKTNYIAIGDRFLAIEPDKKDILQLRNMAGVFDKGLAIRRVQIVNMSLNIDMLGLHIDTAVLVTLDAGIAIQNLPGGKFMRSYHVSDILAIVPEEEV